MIAADASIPDNPSGPNQSAGAEKANLSAPTCDGVVVDRTPPTAAIQTGSASVKVGDLVSFTASASDATSGLAGTAGWTWGDNTAAGSGDAATHTYTHAGTYEVALSVADAAGNTAVAKKTITVAPAGNGTPDDETSGGGTSGGGTTTPPAGGGGPTTPPGGSEQGADAPTLELSAPRSVRARAKAIPVELTASDAGRVQLALTSGKRVLARATVRLDPDGTADHRLKLPKGIKPGRYTLKATFGAITESRSVTLTGKASARRASASSVASAVVGPGPRALPDGSFHGARPGRTFRVGRLAQ